MFQNLYGSNIYSNIGLGVLYDPRLSWLEYKLQDQYGFRISSRTNMDAVSILQPV